MQNFSYHKRAPLKVFLFKNLCNFSEQLLYGTISPGLVKRQNKEINSLESKSIDRFLYNRTLHHERVKRVYKKSHLRGNETFSPAFHTGFPSITVYMK